MLFTVVKTALLAAPLPYRCSQAAAPSCTGYACETTWGRTNGKERLTGVRSDAATAAHCSDVALGCLVPLIYGVEARGSQRAGFLLEKHTWKTRREKAQIEPSRQVVACALENPRASSQRLELGPLRRLLQGVRQPRARGTDRARHCATTCHGARHRATTTPVARPQRPSPDEA